MAFGNARIDNAPSAGQFGAARLPAVPEAGQFGGIASSGPPVEIAAGNLRAWFTLQQADLVFQESTLTTPSGDDDPIGGLVDWYGGVQPLIQATADARPTKRDNGSGIKYAEFDGVDDIIRGATASVWKALHGPNGGGIYVVGEWTGTRTAGLDYVVGTSVSVTGGSTVIGFRGLIRNNGTAIDRPVVLLGNGSAGILDDGFNDSWSEDEVRMAKYENDTTADVVRVQAEPTAEQSTSAAAVTRSSSDGGSLYVTSQTSVFHLYEIVVRSPILTPTEYAALKDYWNTTYTLGL